MKRGKMKAVAMCFALGVVISVFRPHSIFGPVAEQSSLSVSPQNVGAPGERVAANVKAAQGSLSDEKTQSVLECPGCNRYEPECIELAPAQPDLVRVTSRLELTRSQ